MLRVRFHGRGGQGVKTASQIFGTAAFLSGFQAQDFPLYGAERRGAPITAYARLDRDPVLERGSIARPDVVIIGDETLIDDPIAAPLSGVDNFTAVFINSTHTPAGLQDHLKLESPPQALDLSEICLRHINRANILSSALSAASVRVSGLMDTDQLAEAIRMELEGMEEGILQANLDLAGEVFLSLRPEVFQERKEERLTANRLIVTAPRKVAEAAPIIMKAKTMALRKTGNWRVNRPEIDYELCNKCGTCFLRCPDGAIAIREDGYPVIDYDHCKGCLICSQECPRHGIETPREVATWS